MSRLLSREKFIPGGFQFYQPETKWSSQRMASFETIVRSVISHRQANPFLVEKNGLSTDYTAVCNEVDQYNAMICERMGWKSYIHSASNSPPAPKFKALPQSDQKHLSAVAEKVKKVWKGVRTISDWLESGQPAVNQEKAEERASVCVACPLNGQGGLETWFTQPAADAIKRQVSKVSDRKLVTSFDEKLGVCEACLCPMKLKVWTPIEFIKPHVTDDVMDSLAKGKNCWVLAQL